jgi:hypothetical protein
MAIRSAVLPFLCVAFSFMLAEEQRTAVSVQTPMRVVAVDLTAALDTTTCLLCSWESTIDVHNWTVDSEGLCDTPEEQKSNRCKKCDEAHATHCAQGGTWSDECGPPCVESLAALDLLETVQDIVARKSISDLIRVATDPAIEVNLERGIVQLLGCGQRIVAQVPLAPEDIASLSTLWVLE